MKKELLEVIEKVKMLSEKYPEFKEEMERLFAKPDPITEEKISKILSYLGLDVCVDNLDSIVDYSFIEDKNVRDKLISDNREMIRYRYGTRYHDIIFDEYCRYAQFQIEMLFNYYYSKTNNNTDEIKEHIKKFNNFDCHKKINVATSLPSISFINKVWAFANEFNIKEIIDTLDYISRIRNNQSHRGPEDKKSTISNIQKKIKGYGIKLLPDGTIDFKLLREDPVKMTLFNNMLKKEYNDEYKFELWHNKQPYDEIKETIDTIADIIKKKLE